MLSDNHYTLKTTTFEWRRAKSTASQLLRSGSDAEAK
jgi:hypothetical protein